MIYPEYSGIYSITKFTYTYSTYDQNIHTVQSQCVTIYYSSNTQYDKNFSILQTFRKNLNRIQYTNYTCINRSKFQISPSTPGVIFISSTLGVIFIPPRRFYHVGFIFSQLIHATMLGLRTLATRLASAHVTRLSSLSPTLLSTRNIVVDGTIIILIHILFFHSSYSIVMS